MKLTPFFLCSLLVHFSVQAEPPALTGGSKTTSLSLDAITGAVLARNPSIQEARARWEAMKHRVPQAAAWDDLKVSGTTRVARFVDVAANSFTDEMVSVEQIIPLSGRNRSRERIAVAEALTALEDLRRKQLDAVAQARTAYFRLARDYALLELNRANESSLTQSAEASRAKLEVAGQAASDVLLAENEVNQLEEVRHDLLQNISQDETQLNVAMNRDPFTPFGKPAALSSPPSTHFSTDQSRTLLLQSRPEIRSAEAALTAAKAKLELAKREWIPDPTVSVESQRYNGAAQGVSEVGAGISFTVPWLNGKKYHAEEHEAESGIEAAGYALETARATALGLLRDQLQKIETAHHHVELFQTRLLPNARQAIQATRTNFESGQATFSDLLLAERNLRNLEAMAEQHLANHRIAFAELDALIGASLPISSASKISKGAAK